MYDKENGIYIPNAESYIDQLCERMVIDCTIRTRNEVRAALRSGDGLILGRELFKSRYINTLNGILDPKTLKVFPHSSEYLTTSKLPFRINMDADNQKLWEHMMSIIDENDQYKLMEIIWMCISWNNPFKKMIILKGPTNSQKTALSDLIIMIIGEANISSERPHQYLKNDNRFSTSKFIGKRMNRSTEIGNWTADMVENHKSLIGAEKQNTERKGSNESALFDPVRFVFLYTTNHLGAIYRTLDNAMIGRMEFMMLRNVIDDDEIDGDWIEKLFDDEEDKTSAIEYVVRKVIQYKKDQSAGKPPKTKWSTIAETKLILKEEMSPEDKYFDVGRIQRTRSEFDKVEISEVQKDMEVFTGKKFDRQSIGFIMKRNGFASRQSNSKTWYVRCKLGIGNETLD